MALRFSCKNCAVAENGTTINHGLAVVPDEWFMNQSKAPLALAAALYMYAVPTSTSVFVACGSGSPNAASADVFVVVNHSVIK